MVQEREQGSVMEYKGDGDRGWEESESELSLLWRVVLLQSKVL